MNLIVAVPVDENLASFIGKKSSENSIAFYNRKMGDDVIVALLPNQSDEKVYALAESLLVCSQVLLSTANLDRRFGEALVACSLLDRRVLLTDDNDAAAFLKGAGLEGCEVVSRENVLDKLREGTVTQKEEPVRIDIDKAFPVKGVGTVVLGVVTRGTLRQHDRLFHTSGREALVRSIQSQDEDVESAGRGTRVGISLKDIDHKEIEKGDLLMKQQVKRSASVTVEITRTSSAAKESISQGARYGMADGFSYSECTVRKHDGKLLELELVAPMPVEDGDEVLLTRGTVPRVFASGRITGKA
jgi:selenocysteine-specific translation elongation factor